MDSSMPQVDPEVHQDVNATQTLEPGANAEKRKRGDRSEVWSHFKKVEGSIPLKALCNYCKTPFKCDTSSNGTSSMKSHIEKVCKKYPNRKPKDPKQSTLSFKVKEDGGHDLVATTFSQESCLEALAQMVIIDELPFRFVENQGFMNFCRVAVPQFNVPRRTTITRHCIALYFEEKNKLKRALKGQKICVTTDTWTSLQNINYMCLTVHYVDSEWKLNKKILSFCVVPNHKGETIGRMVEKCLLEWGIDSFLTVTCDNASSNNLAIDWLKKKTSHWKNTVLEHKCLHVRCSAHILNLIVRDGLKKFDESIVRIRTAVRYVRSSPSRWATWNKCVKNEKIVCAKSVCLDVATRWNSTYSMLEAAEKFEKAFDRLEDEDDGYRQYFDTPIHPPNEDEDEDEGNTRTPASKSNNWPPDNRDWIRARMFVQFLEIYYKTTNKISGSNYVTSDLLFNELIIVRSSLKELSESVDLYLYDMGVRMIAKFDKYWSPEKINPLLLVSVVLDPRLKLEYVGFSMTGLYGASTIETIKKKVKDTLVRLHGWYASNGKSPSTTLETETEPIASKDPATKWMMHNLYGSLGSMTEVDKYLTSTLEEQNVSNAFDILGWWKSNATKFPILSLIARDVLAIPMTSVASESAFSTGGRILDPFRSCLRPNTVEALICTQNWLRSNAKPIDLQASMKELEQYEEIDYELFEAAISSDNRSD